MLEIALIVCIVLLLGCIALLALLLRRSASGGVDLTPLLSRAEAAERNHERLERSLGESLRANREEAANAGRALREEVTANLKDVGEVVTQQLIRFAATQREGVQEFSAKLAQLTETLAQKQDALRNASDERLARLQESMSKTLGEATNTSAQKQDAFRSALEARWSGFQESGDKRLEAMRSVVETGSKGVQQELQTKLEALRMASDDRLTKFQEGTAKTLRDFSEAFSRQLKELTEANERKFEAMRTTMDGRLKELQEHNLKKLDEMRAIVDQKLQETLNKRLGENFQLISERLEKVHQGLGEMQSLAHGVGDLKRVLSNVKARGTWGEIQLENLLEQFLSPEQFAKDVAVQQGSAERVEFAIRFPGRDGSEVLLPIDAKFPIEDYQRLAEAHDRCDLPAIESAGRALEQRVKACAKDICNKYIHPPGTTPFGIMYLPIEGLYAEVTRRLGLAETLRRDYHVELAGPSTLPALLSSFQMGFRTLAIEQRSGEVRELLGTVKKEFATYGSVIERVKEQIDLASRTIEEKVGRRTRAINRALRKIEDTPAADAPPPLPLLLDDDTEEIDEEVAENN